MRKTAMISIIILIAMAASLAADTVILKTGKRLNGKIVSESADSLEDAEVMIREGRVGAVLVEDAALGRELSEFVVRTKLTNPGVTVLVISSSSEDEYSLGLLRLGAYSILPACASNDVLEIMIHNAMESRYLNRRLSFLNILFWILIFTIPIWLTLGRYIALGKF